MMIDDCFDQFAGLPVRKLELDEPVPSPKEFAIYLVIDYEAHESGESFQDLLSQLVGDPAAAEVEALLIGDWGGAYEGESSAGVVEALASVRRKLPSLRALFLGAIGQEEAEISWIQQSDMSAIFAAFPTLETFYIRGGMGLSLGRPVHESLRKLVIQTGGLDGEVVREVASASLPSLEHLELWLGDDGYGNTVTSKDLAQLLEQGPVGRLRYLGLRDDCRADETAQLLAQRGIPPLVETLDLSLGALTDAGVDSLIAADWISRIQKLDIHHHFVSPEKVAALRAAVVELDADDPQEAEVYDGEVYRYVAVSE